MKKRQTSNLSLKGKCYEAYILKFKFEKELKHSYRYLESNKDRPIVLKTIYIQKWAAEGRPQELTVTVESE